MEPVFRCDGVGAFFFGYYDKSPFDASGDRILANRATFFDRMPQADDVLDVGYFDWHAAGEFRKLAETRAWNWQQGAMLQWLGPDYTSKIIFNDCEDGRFVCKVLDVRTGETSARCMAVYSVHPGGRVALCIDFERLYWVRAGYSYQGVRNGAKKEALVEDDGIWLLDLEQDTARQLIRIGDLLKIAPISSMKSAVHSVEHVMFSPQGTQFAFLHRWVLEDGGIYSRLLAAKPDGSPPRLLHDSGRVTHYCWRDEHTLLAYAGEEGGVNRLRRYRALSRWLLRPILPLYRLVMHHARMVRAEIANEKYILMDMQGGGKQVIGEQVLTEDGHPSFSPIDRNWLVTDTYPRMIRGPMLNLFAMDAGRLEVVARLGSVAALDDSPERCDLHPRWSRDGRYVCVDTMDGGARRMYVYDVGALVGVSV